MVYYFLGRSGPPGYIAGLGRGATGFTTRSDIGPAREASAASLLKDRDEDEAGLFSGLPYEADDEEADKIYASVDAALAKKRREKPVKRTNQPKIGLQLAGAKRMLANVSFEEWDALPSAANVSRKKRDLGRERFVPVPDSVLIQAAKTDFVEMGVARDRVLGVQLDRVADNSSKSVDPTGYLTDLNSLAIKSQDEIGDIKKARLLLKSVTTTNKTHAPGWIAAARLEEIAGRHSKARALILKGCELCPKNEDVWLEAARLFPDNKAREILAKAVVCLDSSVRIWQAAAKLETNLYSQKQMLLRALEHVPTSVKLWKSVISLESEPEDALKLLARAVECVPLSIELWLSLARLESYENARKVLNRARTTIPTSFEIWVAAATLEEFNNNISNVGNIINKAVSSLEARNCQPSHEQWLREAMECEKHGAINTARAIVCATITNEHKSLWIDDISTCVDNKCIECARALYEQALTVLKSKKSMWRRAVAFEKEFNVNNVIPLLERAVSACPCAETLWLMYAKELWLANDVEGARRVLADAFRANPASPEIWLAAVKLEQENKEFDRARAFLKRARQKAGNEPRVWMKSALLERLVGDFDTCIELLKQGIEKFPDFPKFYLIWAQVNDSKGNKDEAKRILELGRDRVPLCVALWIQSALLENTENARQIYDKGRRVLNDPELWYHSIALELKIGNSDEANKKLAKALQSCPESGLLWGLSILCESRHLRRSKSLDAIKKCGEANVYICLAIARIFWSERRIETARSWFIRAFNADPDIGDVYAFWFKFELVHGDKSQVVEKCISAQPKHGIWWPSVAKDPQNIGKPITSILEQVALLVPLDTLV